MRLVVHPLPLPLPMPTLRAWLTTTLLDRPTAAERPALAAFVLPGLVRSCQVTSLATAILTAAWAALDPLFFSHDAHIQRQYLLFRVGTVALQGSILAGLTFSPALRRRPLAWVVPLMWANAALIGWFVSGLGGPSTPWFHFVYPTVFFGIPAPLAVGARLAVTAVGGACVLGGYVAFCPQHARDPFFAVGASFLLWAVLTATVLGQMAFRHTLENFRGAQSLRRFNETLEARVAAQTEALRALATHLDRAREAERAHLARELHDELAQELTALRYALSLAHRRWERDPHSLAPNFADLSSLLTRTTETTRAMLRALRPRLLLEQGLPAALEWLVARANAREGLSARLDAALPLPEVDSEVAATVFRVVQEGLTNTLRHAEATTVTVALRPAGTGLWVRVEDNGRGFDPAARGGRVGLGLVGMRERARAIGGSLHIDSAPGEGARVTLTVHATSQAQAAWAEIPL